ncbi:hypothetical protein LU699_15585 [Luteimonas fraxinea]|uniref:hypothetical protein n=1 Tax=Luteimonas fraxinea TaxID=2901869 RepID=UPI001E3DD9F2|nr:hypothetical protein [Luteimonas fraxinea]UHH09664.1 hypothetical protein LU699_15585 [Luteimonas fraxinea]
MSRIIGFTLRVNGAINYDFFLPSEAGVHQAAADFGLSREDYEAVALIEQVRRVDADDAVAEL